MRRFSHRKIGGMHWLSIYSYRISWCRTKKAEITLSADVSRVLRNKTVWGIFWVASCLAAGFYIGASIVEKLSGLIS